MQHGGRMSTPRRLSGTILKRPSVSLGRKGANVTLSGSDVATLRWINSRSLLAALYQEPGSQTVTELAAAVELSRPTVEAALIDLIEEGWATESSADLPQRKAGRPARRYGFAGNAGLLLGIDVGPHSIVCAVSDLRGKILHTSRRASLDLQRGTAAWEAIKDMIHSGLAAVDVQPSKVKAIAVGMPAVVGLDGEIALTTVVPDWVTTGIPERVRRAFPQAVTFFDNDAKLATLAESEWGYAADVDNAIYVLAGQRLAAGLIVNGQLTRGTHGAAGEIGALAIAGWASAYDRLMASMPPGVDAEHIFVAAAGGDLRAAGAICGFAEDVARGITALSLTVDPEIVIIGGGVSQAGDAFLEPLRAALEPQLLFSVDIRLSAIGANAVSLGGIARALKYLRSSVLELPER